MKDIKGWMRPHELDRRDGREPFDPVVEGSRYRLSRELLLAIWERVCAEAPTGTSQSDLERAKRQFHAVAAGIAARDGRWPHADVGKQTRVETEQGGGSVRGTGVDGLAALAPGRRTLVEAEASRREPATAAAAIGPVSEAAIAEARESIGVEPPSARTPVGVEPPSARTPVGAEPPSARTPVGAEPPSARTPVGASAVYEHRLPAPTLDRMERAFGRRFDDVEIHVDSAEVPAGVEAFTRGRHIFFGRGAFAPGSDHGEHVIAHELAHVAQQSAPTGGGGFATRAALEADAHQAALAALAGHAASVSLFAPAAAALGFSDGNAPHAPSTGSSGGSSSRSTPGAPAPSSARAATSGGTVIPRPRPAASPVAPARSAAATPASVPVSAAPRRGQTADGLHVPEAPSSLTPDAAGRLHTAQAGNQGNAAATTTLPTGQQQTDVGRAAVEEPQAEQDARAQQGVVTDVDDRPPPSPEIEQACARIRQVIRDKRPPSEDKLVDAKPREMAQEAGSQMSGDVEQRAGTVRQGYADMQQPPPGSPSSTPVPPTIPPAGAQTQPVDSGAGTPDPLQPDDVSLDADVADQKKQVEDAGMNTEPGKLVKDGPIGDARGGVDDLQSVAKTDPQKVLADQAAAITKAKGDMHALQQAADKALADARAGTVDQMAKHTTGVKGSEEQQRAQAGEKMKGIFDRTQKAVDTLLQPLSGDAVARWDAGVAQLSTDFEASLADVKRRIDERHSGIGGAFTGAWDWATGLPDWVTEGYDRAEAKFGDGATSLIRDISRDVNKVIDDCKQLIQQARKDIDAVVKSLPASLQTWAQGEAQKLDQQLDALDKRVDQTQKGINKDLINRADGAVQQVREQVADLREKAKGAIAKVAAALVEFAKNPAKAIVNGLLSALGIPPDQFWSLVGQLGDVIGAIAKDPVKFGKGLISGAGQGFKRFFEHFPQHLKEIVLNWVFDQLGATGVPIPSDFSGPSIMSTVLAIVGIDTPLVTAMLGGEISDPDEAAEAHKELAGVLSGDPKALVALLREEFDPASLLPMIKDAAISFLIQTLITQAAERIAALLVPGGAILQAVEAIFKVLQWVINNAARIFTLIQALVGTAAQAVAGNIAGVAAGVENSLVQIIVVAIDFLAGYLGLGGLGGKLKGVIMKLGGKLKTLLKKVVGAVAKRAKARAKTKHHTKHEHSPDKHSPDKHDDDGRDPQKAKDDAKDPRNHQHDPDDKDPRNHDDNKEPSQRNDHDGSDPKRHDDHDDDHGPKKHKDGDEHDPKKHEDGDEHDPNKHKDGDDAPKKKHKDDDDDEKKKNENDHAEARRAAHAAAKRGWAAARSSTEREVKSRGELEHALSSAEHSTPKAKISLEVEDKVTEWTVKAAATVDSAHATDTEGSGWIARGDGKAPGYAARDLRGFNRGLLEAGLQKLERDPATGGSDDSPADDHALYDKKVQQGKQVTAGIQRSLDAEIRGLTAGIEMEPWSQVENDRRIKTKMTIKPNDSEVDGNPSIGGPNDQPVELAKAVAKTYDNGTETIIAKSPSSSKAGRVEIWIGSMEGMESLDQAFEGDISGAFNNKARLAVNATRTSVSGKIDGLASVVVKDGEVTAPHLQQIKKAVNEVAKEVGHLCEKLQSSSLADARKAKRMAEYPILFDITTSDFMAKATKKERKALSKEMEEQLSKQRAKLNEFTVDSWIAKREAHTPSGLLHTADPGTKDAALRIQIERCKASAGRAESRMNELKAELAALRKERAALRASPSLDPDRLAEIEALIEPLRGQISAQRAKKGSATRHQKQVESNLGLDTPDVEELKKRTRLNDQEYYKIEHKEAIDEILRLVLEEKDARFKDWWGIVKSLDDLAALHNPDQVMAGDPHIENPIPKVPRANADNGDDEHSIAEWDRYLMSVKAQVGVAIINSSIGGAWPPKAKDLLAFLTKIPEEAWPLKLLNLRLDLKV